MMGCVCACVCTGASVFRLNCGRLTAPCGNHADRGTFNTESLWIPPVLQSGRLIHKAGRKAEWIKSCIKRTKKKRKKLLILWLFILPSVVLTAAAAGQDFHLHVCGSLAQSAARGQSRALVQRVKSTGREDVLISSFALVWFIHAV